MYSPGILHGHIRFSDAYSSARRVVHSLSACGWDIESLEAEIGRLLSENMVDAAHTERAGPRRHNDITCHDLRAETLVGKAILRTLGVGTPDQKKVPFLAQAYLGSDDSWLQRSPPRRASKSDLWVSSRGYGEKVPGADELRAALCSLALSLDVPPGWRTFAARVFDCDRKRDYALDLWYQQCLIDGLLTRGIRPSCPSGRTFIWWMDDFFEPPTRVGGFVSGLFVGGGQRLGHDFLQIQPSRTWREVLGWNIDRVDPLTWLLGKQPVARYEQLHGRLQSSVHSLNHRQPVIDRWVITDHAFAQVQAKVGRLRLSEHFSSELFE